VEKSQVHVPGDSCATAGSVQGVAVPGEPCKQYSMCSTAKYSTCTGDTSTIKRVCTVRLYELVVLAPLGTEEKSIAVPCEPETKAHTGISSSWRGSDPHTPTWAPHPGFANGCSGPWPYRHCTHLFACAGLRFCKGAWVCQKQLAQ
jgi:hypothetical protein